MDADGSGTPRNLTSTFFNAAQDPEWSPDGDLVVFSDGGDIFVVAADGSSAPQLVQTPIANDRYPSWSPDGNFIAYATNTEIRRVNPDGSNNIALASGLREAWDVAWSPDGSRIAFINDFGNPQVQEELYVMNANGSGVGRVGVDTSINLDWGVAAAGPPPPVLGETATVREVSGQGADRAPADRRPRGPEGSRLRPARGGARHPGRLVRGHDEGHGRADHRPEPGGQAPVGPVQRRPVPGAPVPRPPRKGADRAEPEGLGRGVPQLPRRRRRVRERASRRAVRRLRANAKGRYRSRGKHSAATVRGTKWTMTDRCDGTLTTVKRGKVAVRDFRLKKTIVLRAGKSYLARAQG